MKYLLSLIVCILSIESSIAQNNQNDIIFKAMRDELQRNKTELALPGMGKPFYISYTFARVRQFEIVGALGSILSSYVGPEVSTATTKLIMGNYQKNSDTRSGQIVKVTMPEELDYDFIRRNFWLATDASYKLALREGAAKESALKSSPLPADEAQLPDMIKVDPITKISDRKYAFEIDENKYQQYTRELSGIFKNYKEIFNTSVAITGMWMDVYKQTSEDVSIKQPFSYVNIDARATITTDDGAKINDAMSIIVPSPQDVPTLDELKKKVTEFAENMLKLKNAPVIKEYYSGPVLFEGDAVYSTLLNDFFNQGGLYAYRRPIGRSAGRTLESRMGRKIIDNRFTIKNYTSLEKYNGLTLMGAYDIDADGVIPEKEMTLVDKGILRQVLNGRVPSLVTNHSTGSTRFNINPQNISTLVAPGTLHFIIDKGTKQEKMRASLIKAAKEEGLDYAYIVRSISGLSSRIYKVNVKDGSEEQVRFGDISQVKLEKLKRLLDVSAKELTNNYFLSMVPSSVIYPSSMLVEDVEINKSEPKKDKAPALTMPLQRK